MLFEFLPQAVDTFIVNITIMMVRPRASIAGRKLASQYIITVNSIGSINNPGI